MRTAQDVVDAVDAFLADGRPVGWYYGGWHPDDAPPEARRVVDRAPAPRAFERGAYLVEVFGSRGVLWRNGTITALREGGRVTWVDDGHTYDPRAWLDGESGAKNELLDMLLLARWPRNYLDHTTSRANARTRRNKLAGDHA